jgi:hypothetical protein
MDDPLWIDLSKDSITEDQVWGKVNIPFEPAALKSIVQKSNFLLVLIKKFIIEILCMC